MFQRKKGNGGGKTHGWPWVVKTRSTMKAGKKGREHDGTLMGGINDRGGRERGTAGE